MRISLKSVLAAGLAVGAMTLSASAVEYGSAAPPIATFDYTSNANGSLINQGVANYNGLSSIGSLTLSLTVKDGDTGAGQFDFNNLTIGLDGIDTGIKLNGFLGGANPLDSDGPIVAQDISGAPANASSILAALKADGMLKLTVFDSDADTAGSAPGAIAGDKIGFPANVDAVLQLREGQIPDTGNLVQVNAAQSGAEFDQVTNVSAVPLPMAAVLAPFGVGLAGIYSRRFRRQK
jgi:hypothetical protein